MTTYKTISFALLATLATSSLADDAVGLVRVDVGTNGLVPTLPLGRQVLGVVE